MRNILITGISRGIGRTLAQHFHSQGFHIYGGYKWSENYTDEEYEAGSLAKELENLTLLPFDLADREAVNKLISGIKNAPLDAIVNNAAEFLSNDWAKLSTNNWDRSLAVNLTAPLLLVNGLKDNLVDGASIITIASTDAYYAAYDDLGYAASKAGLINLTKSLAAALANRNIRVNAVAPGWVDTQMAKDANISEFASFQTPLGRNATTQEIANIVEFLISNKASFITASVINADGCYSSVDYVVKKEPEL